MSTTVLIGAQWGDEGKGKIIDLLSKDADYIVRFQGGNNAGHTVVIGENEFILHLIPSGILHPGKICIIGNGVVLNPNAFFEEIDRLKTKGIEIDDRIFISEQAHIIFSYHKVLDKVKEIKKGRDRIGTTGRGIGPCYVDKMARVGIRLADIIDKDVFARKMKQNIEEKNLLFRGIYNVELIDYDDIVAEYIDFGENLKKFACDCSLVLNKAIDDGKNILFEGAQGTLLDIDHGTYPFVTSSSATAGGACIGAGVGPTRIDKIIGVAKAYTTRVGEGPLPTELPQEFMEKFRQRAKEFGATTGRPRRCGWFDAIIVRHSVLVNWIDEIALTKLDVLDEIEKIKICVGYKHKDNIYDRFPANMDILFDCEPIYEELPGWLEDTSKVKASEDLPANARQYIKRLSELLQRKISIVSVGSGRSQAFRN